MKNCVNCGRDFKSQKWTCLHCGYRNSPSSIFLFGQVTACEEHDENSFPTKTVDDIAEEEREDHD